MICLIDGDILCYRVGFAVEKSKYNIYIKGEEHFGPVAVYRYKKEIPDYYSKDEGCFIEKAKDVEPLENALHGMKESLQSVIGAVGATSYKVYLTGEGNFREQISVTRKYKGTRDPDHKPVYYKELKEYLINYWNAEIVNGMEADDYLAIEQTKDPNNTIIASIDKDLKQICGWKYDFVKKEKYWVSEEEAMRFFYYQLLVGDAVDNIQGVVGIGPKKAQQILAGCKTEKEMYDACVKTYNNQELLNEMAQLVYIRRVEGEQWKPPI